MIHSQSRRAREHHTHAVASLPVFIAERSRCRLCGQLTASDGSADPAAELRATLGNIIDLTWEEHGRRPTVLEIAGQFACSRAHVYRLLHQHGLVVWLREELKVRRRVAKPDGGTHARAS